MKNNKAFTLVELLAVIVILSLLVTISGVAVTNIVKKSKNDLYDTQVELIKSAAKAWYADNMFESLPKTINLVNLKKYGFNDKVYNPKTGDETENVSIIIKDSNNDDIIEYEITIDGVTYEE